MSGITEQEFFDTVSEAMDIILLTSGVDFESPLLDYDEAKNTIISNAIPLIRNMMDDPEMSEQEKQIGVIATISVVLLENFYLHHNSLTLNQSTK